MNKLAKFVLTAVTLATCQPAHAEWYELITSESGSKFSLDPSRIKTVGERRHVWVKADHSRDAAVQARSSMTLYSIDCEKTSYRKLSSIRYDSYGKIMSSNSYPDYVSDVGYEPIVPETIMDGISRLICGAGDAQ